MSDPTLWQLLQAASSASAADPAEAIRRAADMAARDRDRDRGPDRDHAQALLAAREALLAAFADPLWRVARVLTRHDADAEDLLQEALVAILTGFDRVREEASLRSWAFGVLANTWRRRFVRPHRRRAQPVGPEPLERLHDEASPDPLASLIVREDVARLREAIARLPAPQRIAIALRYAQDLSYDAIAEATGTTRARVKSRLFEARKRLGTLLDACDEPRDNPRDDAPPALPALVTTPAHAGKRQLASEAPLDECAVSRRIASRASLRVVPAPP